jgi:hypothetical protein
LEKRVGPEGRKLFEKFLRQVNKLQAQQRLEAQARTVGVGWAKSPVADRDGQSAIVRDASDDDPARHPGRRRAVGRKPALRATKERARLDRAGERADAIFARGSVLALGRAEAVSRCGDIYVAQVADTYWPVLFGAKPRPRRIVELKQYAKPATANYQTQPPVHQWLSEVRQAFWPGLDGSAYDLIDLAGAGLFWIREKHVSLIDLPYSSSKRSDIAFLEDLAIYDANVLGFAHGRQAQAAPYHALVESDIEGFTMQREPSPRLTLQLRAKVSKINNHLQAGRCVI